MVSALALALAVPAIGYAAERADTTTAINVHYGDLNVSRPGDAAILLQRIDAAALDACGASSFSFREYRQSVRHSACYNDSMRRAVTALNLPALTASYDDRASGAVSSD